MSNKLGIMAATAGAAFIGYCIYFDHKRRSAPDFKKKLREKRNKAKSGSGKKTTTTLPDPRDSQAMQKFFLNEVTYDCSSLSFCTVYNVLPIFFRISVHLWDIFLKKKLKS